MHTGCPALLLWSSLQDLREGEDIAGHPAYVHIPSPCPVAPSLGLPSTAERVPGAACSTLDSPVRGNAGVEPTLALLVTGLGLSCHVGHPSSPSPWGFLRGKHSPPFPSPPPNHSALPHKKYSKCPPSALPQGQSRSYQLPDHFPFVALWIVGTEKTWPRASSSGPHRSSSHGF